MWGREIALLMQDNPVLRPHRRHRRARLHPGHPQLPGVCTEHFDGRFLEHIPEIAFKYDGSMERTAQIIANNGFEVDWKLWEADYAKCGPCSPGSNCH